MQGIDVNNSLDARLYLQLNTKISLTVDSLNWLHKLPFLRMPFLK